MSSFFNIVSSLLFVAYLYTALAVISILCAPLLLLPHRFSILPARLWAVSVRFGLKLICNISIEFRGLEHAPKGAALIAGKHQSMIDTIAPFLVFPHSCFVYKRELAYLPFLGWYALRAKMVSVKRSDGAKALKIMSKTCRERLEEGRQIIIFPEGTRSRLDDLDPDYKSGIAALYRDLATPVYLMATNSGKFWPAHGINRYAGKIVFEFLPPIEPDLSRAAFMVALKSRLEEASRRLLSSD